MIEITKKETINATVFTVFGYGASQFIRLLGNLILTRLLVPEYFGIISIANVFILGLCLFSDIGLAPGIIRSSRSDDPVFLNTAWTMQVIRSFFIWLFSAIIAYPISRIYSEPLLFYIIPVMGISNILEGFKSLSLVKLDKNLKQGKLAVIELTTKIISVSCIIAVAYFTKSVWALAIGALVTGLIKMVWSYRIKDAIKHRFLLDKASVKELVSFGKWIFLSTAMMFLGSQADRLLLGKLFSLKLFGIYNIAIIFAEISKQVVDRLSGKIIYPYLSHFSNYSRDDFRAKVKKIRSYFLFSLAGFVALLSSFGDFVITFLYDERYYEASWMLPLLAFGMWPLVLCSTIDRSLMVVGKTKYLAFGNVAKFLYMVSVLPLSHSIFGPIGAVITVALNDIPIYAVIIFGLLKEKLYLLKQDMSATIFLLFLIALLIGLRLVTGLGLPI